MLSALLMLRRFLRALEYATREEDFLRILAAAISLVIVGTVAYTFGEDWNVVDALYFAVATLTTSSIADPDLVLQHRWMKVFTVFYILVGIGILVEVLRRLGAGFVASREDEPAKDAGPGS